MRIFLPLLCVLCAARVRGILDGTCLRKEPPSDVLVLSPGSKLVLTCSGHVYVNGVKVNVATKSSNTKRGGSSSDATPTTTNVTNNNGVLMKSDENALSERYNSDPTEAGLSSVSGERRHTDVGYTAAPITLMVQPTSRAVEGESKMDGEGDFEEEEGSRVTRGIKSRPQWKWEGRTVGKGDRDWGEITLERKGATLSLSSLRLTDSGKYTCYDKGRERFSLKVRVADPPETPILSCYKRSPSSKIRCEGTSQKANAKPPSCYLFVSKRRGKETTSLLRLKCAYSFRHSRCWCALEYNEDELRTLHMVYLCVTNIAGNVTSNLLHFRPLSILKPDPPSNVSVKQQVGEKTWMKVTWSFPTSWKSQDSFYELNYEIKYRPRKSSFYHDQVKMIKSVRSYTITDAMPGVEYMIQLRTSEEYDGQWSDWSAPVYGRSWTGPESPLTTTMFPFYVEIEGSGTDFNVTEAPVHRGVEVSHQVLWISGSFALLSVIFAAYIFRHKDRFMSKLQSLSVVTQCGLSPHPPPSAPPAPEGQALVTFAPPRYKEAPLSEGEEGAEEEEGEEENEEEQEVKERSEAMHFNNTSYFFLQR